MSGREYFRFKPVFSFVFVFFGGGGGIGALEWTGHSIARKRKIVCSFCD